MTDKLREAAQMALDALEHGMPIIEDYGGKEQLQIQHKAITALYEALRAALAQPTFALNGIDCSCGRKWRVENGVITASEPETFMAKYKFQTYGAYKADGEMKIGVMPEHDLQDIRCKCCGYMTYHREHMGCIRAAYKAQQEQEPQEDDLSEITNLLPNCSVVKLDNKMFLVQPKTKESKQQWETRRKQIDGYFAVSQEALAQPEQEPVAWSVTYHGIHCNNMFSDKILAENELKRLDEECGSAARTIVPLYTAPPQRDDAPAKAVEWQGLTDEEKLVANQMWPVMDADGFIRAIEAKLREKNI